MIIQFMGVLPFCGQRLRPLLWAVSRAACRKIIISGVPNRLKQLCNPYTIYIIYKWGRRSHNITWRTAGWRPKVELVWSLIAVFTTSLLEPALNLTNPVHLHTISLRSIWWLSLQLRIASVSQVVFVDCDKDRRSMNVPFPPLLLNAENSFNFVT